MKELKVCLTQSQAEFVSSTCKFPLFCAGYGAGKSYVMGFSAVTDAMHSSKCIIGVYEPYSDLIRTVAIPNVQHWLNEFGIRFTLNKNEGAIYTSSPGIGDFYFKSMDNVEALVGYETYRSHIDELDTLPSDKAEQAFFKIMGRNRQAPSDVPQELRKWVEKNNRYECVNRISAYTTPEGFKFCHKMWDEASENSIRNPEFKIYHGKTQDNPALTEDYLDGLRATYPAALLKAYMEGEFVNLESGAVYYAFDRHKCYSSETIQPHDVLYIGMDFNVGNCSSTVFVRRGSTWHIVGEVFKKYDTPDTIAEIKRRWPNHRVIAYPDASGVKRTTANASESDIALIKNAGFEVRAYGHNPKVKDRIAAVNNSLANGVVFVNTVEAPESTKCLEQQAYDKHGDPDKKSGYDHQNDATGYVLAYELRIRKPMFSLDFSFASKE